MIYMAYARGGKSRYHDQSRGDKTKHPNAFVAERELKAMGFDVHCPHRIDFLRKGNNRRPEPYESPYLDNYLFIKAAQERFHLISGVGVLHSTLTPLQRRDVASLRVFLDRAGKEYAEAKRIEGNRDLISQYKAGQALELLDGRFADRLLTFKGVVERSFDLYPKIQMETEMFGRSVLVEADPLDVRRA